MRFFSTFRRVILLAVFFTLPCAYAASGDLDSSFGVNGISTFSMGRASHTPTGFIGLSGGKYLVSFEAPVANGGGAIGGSPAGSVPYGGGIARFNADHTLDTAWGYLGVAGQLRTVSGMALQNGQLLTIENGVSIVENTVSEAPVVARYTTNGSVDPAFGPVSGGTQAITTDNSPGYQQRFHALALAPDGKIVVAGSEQGQVFVARFNADGTSDSTFTTNISGFNPGWVRVSVGGSSGVANAVAVQLDGKIVLVGKSNTTSRGFVARLTTNGNLDTTFATGGIFSFSALADPSDCLHVILEATRILASCTSTNSGNTDIVLLGLTASGVADSTFSTTVIDLGHSQDKLFALWKHTDGRLFVSGRGGVGVGGNQLAIVAVNASGGLDTTFGTNGLYLAPETNAGEGGSIGWNGTELIAVSRRALAVNDDAVITALSPTGVRQSVTNSTFSFSYGDYVRPKILPDGRILAIGDMSFGGVGSFRVSRFNANGSLDTTFGGGGHTSFFTGDDWLWGVRDFAIQSDGNIVVTGGFGAPTATTQTIGVARILQDGGLDPSFNPGANAGQSTIIIPESANAGAGRAVAVQSDGKLVIASRFILDSNTNIGTMLAVRFNTDGTLDTNFGVNGLAKSPTVSGRTQSRAMGMDSDGRAILIGNGPELVRLARFTTSGAVDTSFGIGGIASFSLPSGYSLLFSGAVGFVLPNNKIIAMLNANHGSDGVVGLMRANADGTLDTTFGTNGFSFVTVTPGVANAGNAFHGALSPNGHIALVGFGSQGTTGNVPMIARFTPDGRADSRFGNGGVRYYTMPGQSWVIGIAYAPDGSMILTGSTVGGGRIFANLMKTVSDGDVVGPSVTAAFSRKVHAGQSVGSNVALDLAPPITGPISIEPRSGSAGHTIVFQFDRAITSTGPTSVVDSNGMSLGQAATSFTGNEVRVFLPPIADQTRVKVGVSAINGLSSAEANVGFLFGDVTRSRTISAADVSALKARIVQPITTSDNYLFDLDLMGSINGIDLSIVKSRSGKVLQ